MEKLRLLISPIPALFLFFSITRVLYDKRSGYIRSQCKVLFQSLCTGVSSGYSLESAFLSSRPTIENVFGKRSILARSLRHMEYERAAQLSFHDSLIRLCYRMDFMEIYPIMQALSITRLVGNGVLSILRNSYRMISELISVQQEVDANNAGKNAEAAILCFMPYAVTFTLTTMTGEYMESAKSTTLGNTIMIAAFFLSLISCVLLLRLVGNTKQKNKRKNIDQAPRFTMPSRLINVTTRVYKRIFPASFVSGEYERAIELSQTPSIYLERKTSKFLTLSFLSGFSLLVLALVSGQSPLLLLLGFPFSFIALHMKEKERVRIRKESLMDDIPLFLSILTTLLNSGILLPKSLQVCSEAFPRRSILCEELWRIKKQIASGVSAAQAIEDLSARTPIPEAQAALVLAAGYERRGGAEVLQLLSLQSNACWNLCRNASRKRKERDTVQMILPMMLDLIAVLLVVMVPAIISMQQ